jgi:4-amino-4-deoxychorismate lyase
LYNGRFDRLAQHQARIEDSFRAIFKKNPDWNLEKFLNEQAVPPSGLYKCRVVYDDQYHQVEYQPYQVRPIKTLKLVMANDIEYRYKWENRDSLESLFKQRASCDDILIVKNGQITDSSYANVAFQQEGKWFTPKSCLLPGTMRQFLLAAGVVEVCEITEKNLKTFDHCKLINAMLGWESPVIDVSNIY